MSKMKELYEKVAGDSTLQAKFVGIMKDSEAAGAEVTKENLTAFAKEAGFGVTMEEMQEFFKELAEPKEGELSDAELDMVAGGKAPLSSMTRDETIIFHPTSLNTQSSNCIIVKK